MRAIHLYHDSNNFEWPSFNLTQREFVESKDRFLCLSGGYGSGKTTALTWRCIALSIDTPFFGDMTGNVGLLGRSHTLDFEKTTLPELMRWLPRKWIRRHWRKDGVLELINGSVMHFTHLDDKEHLQSYNVGFVGIDQMEQIDWRVFEALGYERSRLKVLTRFDKKGNIIVPRFDEETGDCISTNPEEIAAVLDCQYAFGACNPRRGTWIYNKFVNNEKYKESPLESVRKKYNPDYRLILSSTYENKANLPKGYIERQKRDKSPREYQRSVMGSWDVFEGQVYSDFTDNLILDEDKVPHPSWDIYVGIDHGGTGYDETKATGVTSITFGALEQQPGDWDKLHVFAELYLQGVTIEETVGEIAYTLKTIKIARKYHYDIPDNEGSDYAAVKAWRCGHDMFRGIQDTNESIAERYMRYAGLIGINMPLAVGDTDERLRIEKTNWMFRKELMDVSPKCTHYIESHRSVEYGKNEKIKVNQDDHSCESGSYMMSALPVWHQRFNIPKQHESLVERELRLMQQNDQYDSIYGNRYATG